MSNTHGLGTPIGVLRALVYGGGALVLLWAALVGTPVHAQSGPVQYGYDGLGRLVIVVDGAGQAAIYNYDPVGNLLSIQRIDLTQLPGSVAIAYFTPTRGPIASNTTGPDITIPRGIASSAKIPRVSAAG